MSKEISIGPQERAFYWNGCSHFPVHKPPMYLLNTRHTTCEENPTQYSARIISSTPDSPLSCYVFPLPHTMSYLSSWTFSYSALCPYNLGQGLDSKLGARVSVCRTEQD